MAARRRTEPDRVRPFSADLDPAGGVRRRLWIFLYRCGESYFGFAQCGGIFDSRPFISIAKRVARGWPDYDEHFGGGACCRRSLQPGRQCDHDQRPGLLQDSWHQRQCEQLRQLWPRGHCLYPGCRSGGANFLSQSRRCLLHGSTSDPAHFFFAFTVAVDEVSSAGFDAGNGLNEATQSIRKMVRNGERGTPAGKSLQSGEK